MTPHRGKTIIISAPSGCGKSTIINRLIADNEFNLKFSISATNRPPRGAERHGVEYYFLSDEEFRSHISSDDFLEYEEVYPGRFYGTLQSEIERICGSGCNCILDIDVKGAVNVKKHLGDDALSIFIEPPSLEELRKRLEGRGTDSSEDIRHRMDRAKEELTYAPAFDRVIVNDILDKAVDTVASEIRSFLNK